MLSLGSWRDVWRLALIVGAPAFIIWLGSDAIGHIDELYSGLCPVQGSGMERLLYDDNPQGYCTGIGQNLDMLKIIMGVAVVAVISTLLLWWDYYPRGGEQPKQRGR